ncbi:hypothetical protein GLOIN_2v1848183 [Rhizophagus irregularis DAOM 181602=DAOM 197198]|uniref:BTB domain-containing protein n=1 Tax=Rhizophagus irregularis (strain DAOM 181602 / DAOM 197198 / MUCL 43194) TaxID=747089 RepID=A0A2P4P233_RHIID|nr:hypothetical protein GLOIN_2v1848183 [Rhizophagus irregularis DAOM 181602=DAOM 197198]POG59428.1 hypothetical protein GLOIN_2v1848183 [Rhizophagus irregularis DAOM 181602=DAOM 197198]|eukprot:XP_025166294.1 hypothetical protein GLOIN_2v1848183 [Rhizophagus irregularis DAOM 181602=DAOM 197198]
METFENYSNLLQDFSSMLDDADDHDVLIQVGENQDIEEFRAHSNILRARSKYFKAVLSNVSNDLFNGKIKIKKSNIIPSVFKIILKYAYIGEVNLSEQPVKNVLELLIASDELHLEELFEYAQDFLIENRTSWVQHNLIHVFRRVSSLSNCKKLQNHCIESVSADPQSFITSKEFLFLDKAILYELLERNDFLIEEVIVWDYLIKWGIEQTHGLGNKNSDRIKWNDENYEALKETLSQFIPLIRFSEISSVDFYDKVYPFKAVIPNHIYEEVFEFYMKETSHTCNPVNDSWDNWNSWNVQPNRTKNKRRSPQIDTTSVSNGWGRPPPHPDGGGWDLANNIPVNNDDDWGSVNNNDSWTNWSTTLDESSRDSSISLWQTSDPPRQTVTDQPSLAQDLTKIYGEYQSHIHIHNGQRYSVENFIFSFTNDDDIKNMKICRMNYDKLELNYGNKFNFSNVFRMNGSDIEVNNSAYNDKNVINPNIKMFVPKEIEVFLISSKSRPQ